MTTPRRPWVHVFATFGRGGPQVRAVQLMRQLGVGYRHVVMAMDGNTDARTMLDPDLDVRFVTPPARAGFRATRRAQMTFLQEETPELVLTYNWGAIETAAAARRLRLPLVHHEDGFGPEETERRFVRRSLMRRWLLRRVPVVVPSRVLHQIAMREWRLSPGDVHHLVNGVDLQRFRPPPEAPAAKVLGSVGGLRPEKDHDNLLRALSLLPVDVRLCLVGSGPCGSDLRKRCRQLGLADRVEFVGHTDDTAAYYRRFSVFVLSSRTEQMPIAMLEAMASGLPVVATDVGDVKQVLPEPARKWVVPAGNTEALAKALATVLGDEGLRRRLGGENRVRCEERFGSGGCGQRFLDLYLTTKGN
ncbi:MAG TPA: glycosyltransferase family 1 protein [bacterium]|nr:glycosyltransferase family 1 protein [bacterium]